MGQPLTTVVPRNVEASLVDLMAEEPTLVVNGARTAGKSTLLRACASRHGAEVIDLDDPGTRDAAREDPGYFVSGPSPVMIDEFQHVPELLDAIKSELNRDTRPGRFVLTGSARYLTLPRASQSLAGRVHVATMWPLSQGELAGTREQFIDRLLHAPDDLRSSTASDLSREEYHERVLAGGFPAALARRTGRPRQRWYRDYITTVITRDVLDLRKVRQRAVLPRILARLVSQTGQLLNVAEIARSVELEANLVGDFVQLLETVFFVHRLPAFGRTLSSKVVKRPKVHVVDTGLGAHMLEINESKLASRDPAVLTEIGHLVETFAVNEILKQASWSDSLVELSHFRTHDHHEVDLVMEAEDGRIAAVEVKAAGRVTGSDCSGMQLLRDKLGTRFVGGAMLYLGNRSYRYDDRIYVLPLDRLWT